MRSHSHPRRQYRITGGRPRCAVYVHPEVFRMLLRDAARFHQSVSFTADRAIAEGIGLDLDKLETEDRRSAKTQRKIRKLTRPVRLSKYQTIRLIKRG